MRLEEGQGKKFDFKPIQHTRRGTVIALQEPVKCKPVQQEDKTPLMFNSKNYWWSDSHDILKNVLCAPAQLLVA